MQRVPTKLELPKESKAESLLLAVLETRNVGLDELSAVRGLGDPLLIHDMSQAATILAKAIEEGKTIAIYGDYDVDGGTAAATLYRGFQRTLEGAPKAKVLRPYVPERIEGYGLTTAGVDKLKELGAEVIVTVDNGTSAVEAIQYAKEIGMTVVITDHHPAQGEVAKADAVVNPQLLTYPNPKKPMESLTPEKEYGFPYLCGAGVAFMLLWALEKKGTLTSCKDLISLPACGTMADVMPLKGPNRKFVQSGTRREYWMQNPGLAFLDLLSLEAPSQAIDIYLSNLKSRGQGVDIKELYTYLNRNRLFKPWKTGHPLFKRMPLNQGGGPDWAKGRVTSYSIGFHIAPRINAAGRMKNASTSLDLLLTDDPFEAWELAKKLDELNTERKKLEKKVRTEAEAMVAELPGSNCAIVLQSKKWEHGIIGPVAAGLAAKYGRPVYLGANENGVIRGSARTGAPVSCAKLLDGTPTITHGGHAAAAGFAVSEDQWEAFRRAVLKNAKKAMKKAPTERVVTPDVCWKLPTQEEINELILTLEPFGKEFESPRILVNSPRVISVSLGSKKDLKSNYTTLELQDKDDPKRTLRTSMFARLEELAEGGTLSQVLLKVEDGKLMVDEVEMAVVNEPELVDAENAL